MQIRHGQVQVQGHAIPRIEWIRPERRKACKHMNLIWLKEFFSGHIWIRLLSVCYHFDPTVFSASTSTHRHARKHVRQRGRLLQIEEKVTRQVLVRHHKYIWYGATVCDHSIFPAYHLLWLQYLLGGPVRHYSANQMVLTWHWNMRTTNAYRASTQYLVRSFFVANKITFSLKLDKDLANCGEKMAPEMMQRKNVIVSLCASRLKRFHRFDWSHYYS